MKYFKLISAAALALTLAACFNSAYTAVPAENGGAAVDYGTAEPDTRTEEKSPEANGEASADYGTNQPDTQAAAPDTNVNGEAAADYGTAENNH